MRVLFLTHRLPYAPNRGDRIRSYHLLRTLASRFEVDLVSLVHDDDEASHAGDLRDVAASVTVHRTERLRNLLRAASSLPTSRPLTHALLHSSGVRAALDRLVHERRPDVVLALCSGMARFALEPPLLGTPLVVDLVDVDSQKWAALGRARRPPMRWIYRRESRCLARFEAALMSAAYAATVVNERELEALHAITRDGTALVVPNGVDLARLAPTCPPVVEPRVVFSGVMSYGPNVDGAVWFAREVWPRLHAAQPGARFVIAGSDPAAGVRALARRDPTIEVTGTVPDLRPHLWRSAVAVAPLAIARGVQNKALEALAAGLPCVVTPAVLAGLPLEARGGCVTATGPEGFAAAVLSILERHPSERRALASRADLRALDWRDRLAPFVAILEAAAIGAPKRPYLAPATEAEAKAARGATSAPAAAAPARESS